MIRDITIGQYYQTDSVLHRLDPRVKLIATIVFIITGAIAIFIFEYNNPLTIKEYSFWEKIEVSLFQSITTRTAGFVTIPQENLTNASAITCLTFLSGSII